MNKSKNGYVKPAIETFELCFKQTLMQSRYGNDGAAGRSMNDDSDYTYDL